MPQPAFDRLAHCGVGHVHAEAVLELIDDLELELSLVVVEVGLVALHGRVDLGDEEAGVLYGVDEEEVLLHTLHGGAGLCTEQSVKVVVAALDGALEDGAGIGTCTGGHVVACEVGRRAARRAQAAGEAAGQVEQNLRDIVAVVSQSVLPFFDRLRDELVLSVLKEVFKVDKMLKVFQAIHLFFKFTTRKIFDSGHGISGKILTQFRPNVKEKPEI